jgi:hypothetical protein
MSISSTNWHQIYSMEHCTLKNVNNCLNTNIYSYLETSGGQSSNLYLNVGSFFSTPVKTRYLWQFKTVVFLHWFLICTVLLFHRNLTLIYIVV